MPVTEVTPAELRLTIDPAALGFADTSELLTQTLPWIGQQRAQIAARFGLEMGQRDYNLFVLGEVGSGRSTLLRDLAQTLAAPGRRCRAWRSGRASPSRRRSTSMAK